MAGADNPITGADTKIELLVNGVPVKIIDTVTGFRAEPVNSEVVTMPLGTFRRLIDKIPGGWQGEIEVARNSSTLDDIQDAIDLARRERIPYVVHITHTDYFKDGTSAAHIYQNVEFDFSTEFRRDSVTSTRITWSSGEPRI